MLAIFAGVNVRAGHHHLGIEVLGVAANEIQQTCRKRLGVLSEEGMVHV